MKDASLRSCAPASAAHQHLPVYLNDEQIELHQLAYNPAYIQPSPAEPQLGEPAWPCWPEGLAERIQLRRWRRDEGGRRCGEDARGDRWGAEGEGGDEGEGQGEGESAREGVAVLGRGGFGVVISATLDGVIPVAAKLLQPRGQERNFGPASSTTLCEDEALLADFRAEYELLMRIGVMSSGQVAPGFCMCRGTCVLLGRPALILDRYEGGSLYDALQLARSDAPPLAHLGAFLERWHLAPQLASALAHLHSLGVIHRDVKVTHGRPTRAFAVVAVICCGCRGCHGCRACRGCRACLTSRV